MTKIPLCHSILAFFQVNVDTDNCIPLFFPIKIGFRLQLQNNTPCFLSDFFWGTPVAVKMQSMPD